MKSPLLRQSPFCIEMPFLEEKEGMVVLLLILIFVTLGLQIGRPPDFIQQVHAVRLLKITLVKGRK